MAVRSCILYCALRFSFHFFHQLHFPLFGPVYPSFFLRVYLKSRKYGLFLQTQRDFALKSLGIHKGFLRLFALHPACVCEISVINFCLAIPHNSKCRYGERGAAAAKPKAQIILDAAKVSAASGGNSEPKQGQRSQSARGLCPRSTMRVPQPDIIEHFGNADAVPQPPERCLSR